MIFEYDGIKIFCDVSGQGAPLLLLHGWGCSHTIFDSFCDILCSKHTVYAIDFPGFGLSEEPKKVWGVEEYTAMLEAFCDSQNIKEPEIIAHSFGGRVAILMSSRRPCGKMVFTDVAGIKPRRSLKYWLKVYGYKLSRFFLLKICHNQAEFERRRASAGSEDYRNASPMMKAVLSKVVNRDLSKHLRDIKSPVLLFWGENDTATPLRDAKKMARLIPDAGLVTVPGGSHFSFLDNPALFRVVISNFLG